MSNEEVMNLMVEMGLHEGGMENWVMDNAWVAFANRVSAAEREACVSEVWPTETKVWSEEELQAMTAAFNRTQEKHGWYETLMAVGASVLKMKAAAIRARGQS